LRLKQSRTKPSHSCAACVSVLAELPTAGASGSEAYDKVDWRRWIVRRDAHDRRLDLGRRSKVVAADLEHVSDLGEQLRVGRQAAVQLVARRRQQAQRELALEHQQRASAGPSDQHRCVPKCWRWWWRQVYRKSGRCASSLKTSGDEIWYGVLATHTSKYGRSILITSPTSICSFDSCSLSTSRSRRKQLLR